jgi:hypothetical protein
VDFPLFPSTPDGRPSPEQVVAEALWRSDLDRTGTAMWAQFRDVVPFARVAVRALRECGAVGEVHPRQPLRMKRRSPLPRFRDEADLAERAIACLAPYFHVQREVQGTHFSGRRLRIDAILRPRDTTGWRDPDPAFGVEFKIAHQGGKSTNEFTNWARQAVDYTHTNWDGYGRLPVFACPSIVDTLPGDAGWLMAHLLGQFGVGELMPVEKEGWALTVHGDQILWSQRRGPAEAQRRSLHPKVGNSSVVARRPARAEDGRRAA